MFLPSNLVQVDLDVEIEYVSQPLAIPSDDPAFAEFASVFEKFNLPNEGSEAASVAGGPTATGKDETEEERERRALLSDEDEAKEKDETEEEEKPAHSKARLRRMNRLTVAELKQLVKKPEVVEVGSARHQCLVIFLVSDLFRSFRVAYM